MFIFISHLNNVLALGIFHQVMKHHPMRVCDVAPICSAPHSRGIKPVIYTGVIRVVEGLPFLCTRRCSASGLEMRFICKINKEQAPTPCFFPSSHQTRSHTHKYPLTQQHLPSTTHTHTQTQTGLLWDKRENILDKDDRLYIDEDLSCQRFFAGGN